MYQLIYTKAVPRKYKLARLLIPNIKSKDQRWVIKYWCEDSTGVYRLFREFDFQHLNVTQRKDYANRRIAEINAALKKGAYAEPTAADSNDMYLVTTLQNTLANLRGLRPTTIKNYTIYTNKLIEWLNEVGFARLLTERLTNENVNDFINYLFVCKLSNRTINNHIEHITTIFNKAKINNNPFAKFPKFQTEIGRNIAYNEAQRNELTAHMAAKDNNLLMVCKHMYYTLMRPNEISQLKVGDIAAYHQHQIAFSAEVSKNKMYRNITLPKGYEDELLQWLAKFNAKPDWFLFGRKFMPGPNHYPPNQMADSYRTRVLVPLNYSKDYTFYSWKHTGVVSLYRAGVKPYAIRLQLGHINDKSFETYLKSLGLFENDEIRNHYPDF